MCWHKLQLLQERKWCQARLLSCQGLPLSHVMEYAFIQSYWQTRSVHFTSQLHFQSPLGHFVQPVGRQCQASTFMLRPCQIPGYAYCCLAEFWLPELQTVHTLHPVVKRAPVRSTSVYIRYGFSYCETDVPFLGSGHSRISRSKV